MQNSLDEIVADLVALDPEFAKMESEIRILANKMIAAKPDCEIDFEFKNWLKNELLARIDEMKNAPAKSLFNFFPMQKFFYSLGGAAIALVVFFGVQNFDRISPFQNFVDDSISAQKIVALESRAFGSLADESVEVAAGKGGGGGVTSEPANSRIAIDREFEIYKYIYSEPIRLSLGEVEVLRRVQNSASTENLFRSLAQFDFGLVDFGALQNVAVRNFNLVEDREFGYSISVNLEEGDISIDQNWGKWPDPYSDCGDENCWESLRLAKSDMLSDSQILAIADGFVQKFGVDLQNYGAPEIQNNWTRELARFTGDESDFYFPENISVVFPLKIQNQNVFSSGGSKGGLNVSVDQRTRRVIGIYNLTTQNYESSKYAAVTDEQFFREFLERGGMWGGYFPEGGKIVEVALGEPEEVLLEYWNYENGESSELILPALRFPILGDNPNIYRTAIVVPLVAEILEKQNSVESPILFEDEILKIEKIENDPEQNDSDPDDGEKN